MGMFSKLMSKIMGRAPAVASAPASIPAGNPPAPVSNSGAPPASPPSATAPALPASPPPATAATAPVDVDAVLSALAAKNSEKLDWKKSIVDLLKLVGMDSGLSARKELATELGYSGDQSDSAQMNVWLHKEVLKKLAANGGKVPPGLLD